MQWGHKDEWKKCGNGFCIIISRHNPDRNDNIWCIYAYIYPKHPHFDKFTDSTMFQDAVSMMPFHGGPSYFRKHKDNDKVISIQMGCDYNHIYDDNYLTMKTKEDAASVFYDADILFNWLEFYSVNS